MITDLQSFVTALQALLAEANAALGNPGSTGGGVSLPELPGFVVVSPTGPKGAGKHRYWPQPHPEQGEMLLGYATRCMNTNDPMTGKPCYQNGRYGPILQGACDIDKYTFAQCLDKVTYSDDWFTQEELDRYAALAARDAAANGGKGAPWISGG